MEKTSGAERGGNPGGVSWEKSFKGEGESCSAPKGFYPTFSSYRLSIMQLIRNLPQKRSLSKWNNGQWSLPDPQKGALPMGKIFCPNF